MIKRNFFLFMVVTVSQVSLSAEVLTPTSDQQLNTAIVNIWVNGVDYGVESVAFDRLGKKFIECTALSNIGIVVEKLEKDSVKKDFCSLASPSITFTEDPSLQSLNITIPAEYFANSSNNFVYNTPSKASFGGFLNYSLLYSRDEVEEEFNTLAELGIFKDYWLFKNSFIYRNNPLDTESKFLRVESVFELEFPDKFWRLTLGDNTTSLNSLNNSFRFGGLSFGTNYIARPDFVYWNSPTLQGSAAVPSTVDLYLNGVNLYRENVGPGNYSLPTSGLLNKSGNAQIVVEDILGNRTVRNFPIYINNRLLKPKLDEFNISIGKLRYGYDEVESDYRDFFTKLLYRSGINNYSTLGTDMLYSDKVQNVSLLWTQAIKNYVLLDTILSGSNADDNNGYAASLGISRDFAWWSVGMQSQIYSKEYRYLDLEDTLTYKKMTNLFYLTLTNLNYLDSVGLNYIDQTYYNNDEVSLDDRKVLNLSLGKRLTPKLDVAFGYFKDFGGDSDSGFNIVFNYDWGDRRRLTLDHYTQNENTRLNYSRTTIGQEGFDYTVGVNHMDNEVNLNGYGLWKTNVGDLRLSHDEYSDGRLSQVNFNGALVWLGNQVALTKYVNNSFALLNVSDHADLDIYRSSSLIGKTNQKGYMFVHNIIPYIQYDLSFDQNQLNMDETFDYASKKIVGLDQRGYKVNFPIYQTKRIAVRLIDAQRQPLIRGAQVVVNDKTEEPYFVDSKGVVYVYATQAAAYKFFVNLQGGQTCQANVVVSQNQFQDPEHEILDVLCK